MRLRPFNPSSDFEMAKRLVPDEWLRLDYSGGERIAHEELVIADMLVLSTYAIVAEEYGKLAGLLVARFDDCTPGEKDVRRWKRVIEHSTKVLSNGSEGAKKALAMEQGIPALLEQLGAQAGDRMPENNELLLFLVSPDFRGHGVGSALVKRFEDHLAMRGSHSYYLLTDESCTYGYYDRHGFERIARVDADDPDKPGEKIASFYYRRDLPAKASAAGSAAPETAPASAEPITYRPFDRKRDLESAFDVVPAVWRPKDPEFTDEMLSLSRHNMFYNLVNEAPFLRVAVQGDKVVGVLAGRFGEVEDPIDPEAKELAAQGRKELMSTPCGKRSQLRREIGDHLEHTSLAMARYKGLVPENNELILFINHPSVRGTGVGGALLTRFEDYLRAQGAKSYFLFTDTDCTYDFYERHGFTRVAMCTGFETDEAVARIGEASRIPPEGEEGYVYVYTLEPQVDELDIEVD